MNYQQLLLVIRARWMVAAVIFLTVVVTTAVVSLRLPKRYTASTEVVVDVRSADPVAGASSPLTAAYMGTQVDIINSERMAQRVITMLALDQVPATKAQWLAETRGRGTLEQWLAPSLLTRLEVSPSRDSSVIRIAFSGGDPNVVSAVANAFAQAYIDLSLELRVGPASQYAAWFDTRAGQLRSTLEKAQESLSTYQREKGIVATDEGVDYETARLNEISSQLTQIQALRADTSSRQSQAGAGNDDIAEVLQNPLISNLKSDLVRAEARWQDAQGRLGPNHPDYIQAQSDVTSLRDRITLETRRVAASLASSNRVSVERESELRAALDAQKQRVLRLKEDRDGLKGLQRDVDAAQKAYDVVSQGLARSNLESQVQQTNIAVLTAARPPLDPTGPSTRNNTMVAMFLGTLLGLGTVLLLELLQPRVRSADDLARGLGVPVLAVIGGRAA